MESMHLKSARLKCKLTSFFGITETQKTSFLVTLLFKHFVFFLDKGVHFDKEALKMPEECNSHSQDLKRWNQGGKDTKRF